MPTRRSLIPAVLLLAVAACQPVKAPPTAVAPSSASPGSSSAPASSVAPSSLPAASAAPAASPSPLQTVMVNGKVYNDEGGLLKTAKVELTCVENPSLNRTVDALGGAFIVSNIPVGVTLKLRAFADGFNSRERSIKTAALVEDATVDPNEVDFGGNKGGMLQALSEYPEIASVSPANKQADVTSRPLTIKLAFSQAIRSEDRGILNRLLRVQFQVPGGTETLTSSTAFDNEVAKLAWNDAGSEAVFTFGAPLVVAKGSSITIGFDETQAEANWPKDVNGRRLGRAMAVSTYTGTGASVSNKMAPFVRSAFDAVLPSARPSAMPLWGMTHATTSTFSLAPDTTKPRVVSVRAMASTASGNYDRFVVKFDEPIRGYPEAALDGSALKVSNYRYVLGKTDKADEAKSFKAADPATTGATPSFTTTPYYLPGTFDTVVLPIAAGTLSKYTDFKMYVDAGVKDIAGNPVQTSTPDPTTGAADNIVQGKIE